MMLSRKTVLRIFQYFICIMVMSVACLVAVRYGVEEKSWLEKALVDWGAVLGGGVFGAAVGVFLFSALGTIGFVAGPAVFGSVGLFWLVAGGALGGLGLGAVVDKFLGISRNPNHYKFDWIIIAPILVVGFVVAHRLSRLLAARVASRFGDG